MPGVQHILIEDDYDEMRLDRYLLTQFPMLSIALIGKMCRKGDLRLNKARVKVNTRLSSGQILRVPPMPDELISATPRTVRISKEDRQMMREMVIYKDEDVLVLNKPHGLAVQGGTKTTRHIDGLSEALKFERDNKPHLVHRLDRDTSGLLILARHPKSAQKLSKIFQSKEVEKVYWAMVAGAPHPKQGRIRYGLVKASGHGQKGEGEKMISVPPMEVDNIEGAKHATTDYLQIETAGGRVAWLAMSPITGRTHQLRAHAAALGHPIIGDGKYGGTSQENSGDGWGAGIGGDVDKKLHLHARSLRFPHPFKNREMHFVAPLPDHMLQSFKLLDWTDHKAADQLWRDLSQMYR